MENCLVNASSCWNEMTKCVANKENLSIIPIKATFFEFEERVKLNCFYCSKYDTRWTCPPRIPDIDYHKILQEYDHAAIIAFDKVYEEKDYELIRNESTNVVHRTLLELEKLLYSKNNSMAVSFIGGSCKLCKNGCGADKCNNPGMARIPLEATGINIIKSLKNIGIDIVFPIETRFQRYGLILW